MKKIICLLLLAVMLVSVAGCAAAGDEWETTKKSAERLGDQLDDAQIRKMSQMILDAIITEDMDMAYSLITADMTKEDFTAAYQDMRLVLDGVDTYELLAYNKHVNTVVGSKQVVQIQYMLTAEGRRILLNVAWDSSTPDGLVGFHIYNYVPLTYTGALDSMAGADTAQWILVVIGVLEIAFMVWMFVDCCCHKMKRKWLWLLIIALGAVAIGGSVNGGNVNFGLNVGLFLNLYTAMIRYNDGTIILRFMIPVGAVIYACMRRSLFRRTQEEKQEMQLPQEMPENTQEKTLQEKPFEEVQE